MSNQNTYKPKAWNALCDSCGFKKKSTDLKLRWDGLMVCADTCWEPRHPQDFLRARKETSNRLPWTRPDSDRSSVPVLPAPSILWATAGDAEVVVNWTPVPGADSYTLYVVSPAETITGITDPNYTHTGLTNGNTYCYTVTATLNSAGESAASPQACARPVAPPLSNSGYTFTPSETDSNWILSNGNYTATGTALPAGVWGVSYSQHAYAGGSRYFEMVIDTVGVPLRVGVANAGLGIQLGLNGLSYGYDPDGSVYQIGSPTAIPSTPYTSGDVIGIGVDGVNTYFYKNGVLNGSTTYYAQNAYPAVSVKDASYAGQYPAVQVTIFTKTSDLQYLPLGFTGWGP